jgi:hypothetical protein
LVYRVDLRPFRVVAVVRRALRLIRLVGYVYVAVGYVVPACADRRVDLRPFLRFWVRVLWEVQEWFQPAVEWRVALREAGFRAALRERLLRDAGRLAHDQADAQFEAYDLRARLRDVALRAAGLREVALREADVREVDLRERLLRGVLLEADQPQADDVCDRRALERLVDLRADDLRVEEARLDLRVVDLRVVDLRVALRAVDLRAEERREEAPDLRLVDRLRLVIRNPPALSWVNRFLLYFSATGPGA